ncbi:MAG: anion permease [Acidobacteria bacterium]|nr:anion permease [Acidobacteriota bacterium]
MAQPMPWAIAAMLPMLVFPAFGVMAIGPTVQLYGQTIFFWIMGTVLVGYALERHGLAERFALRFLALPRVGGHTGRLAFVYMAVTGLISSCVSDAATIGMMIPIGMSIVVHVRTLAGAAPQERTRFGAFMTLGTFYAAVAGGTATILGIPHNAIAISLLERFTGRSIGWFNWMLAGVPVFLTLLVLFYLILRLLLPPEIHQIPGGEEFLKREREKLGPMSSTQKRVLFVFAFMVILFIVPPIVSQVLGKAHPLAKTLERSLPIWSIPPAVMFLLFTIPAGGGKGEALLTWKDAVQHGPWNVMLLCMGALAMAEALAQFGFVAFMGDLLRGAGLGPVALAYVAAASTAWSTDFISGTAVTTLFGSILIPAAINAGFNPASMAILIANVALGLTFPWAGAAASTAFSLGDIDMARMIKVGIIVTVVFAATVATIHILLSPFV